MLSVLSKFFYNKYAYFYTKGDNYLHSFLFRSKCGQRMHPCCPGTLGFHYALSGRIETEVENITANLYRSVAHMVIFKAVEVFQMPK